jgi:hypothetical protein
MRVKSLLAALAVASAASLGGDMATAQLLPGRTVVPMPNSTQAFRVNYDDTTSLSAGVGMNRFGSATLDLRGHAVVISDDGGAVPPPGPFHLRVGGPNFAPVLAACIDLATSARLAGGHHVISVGVNAAPQHVMLTGGEAIVASDASPAAQVFCQLDP